YARSAEAQDGLTKLRRHIHKDPPANLHGDLMLLWASLHLDGLMTADERAAVVRSILSMNGHDGGWGFGTLESRPTPGSAQMPSDGYSTAFTVYVFRQAGMRATQPEIVRGIRWLRANQRVSGRWVTPAPVDQTEGGVGSRDL